MNARRLTVRGTSRRGGSGAGAAAAGAVVVGSAVVVGNAVVVGSAVVVGNAVVVGSAVVVGVAVVLGVRAVAVLVGGLEVAVLVGVREVAAVGVREVAVLGVLGVLAVLGVLGVFGVIVGVRMVFDVSGEPDGRCWFGSSHIGASSDDRARVWADRVSVKVKIASPGAAGARSTAGGRCAGRRRRGARTPRGWDGPPHAAARGFALECDVLGRIWLASAIVSSTASAAPLVAVVVADGAGEVVARVEGQVSDLEVELVIAREVVDDDAAARALAARHGARVVVWFRLDGDAWLVHVAEPAKGARLVRRVVADGALATSAAAESAALVVRSVLRALAGGGAIGVEQPAPRRRPRAPPPPPPPAAIASPRAGRTRSSRGAASSTARRCGAGSARASAARPARGSPR